MVIDTAMPLVDPSLGDQYTRLDRELVARALLFIQTHFPNLRYESKVSTTYVEYATEIVRLLTDPEAFHVDSTTLAAALISYPAIVAGISYDEIEKQIGYEVVYLVKQICAQRSLEWQIWDTPLLRPQTEHEHKQGAIRRDVLRRTYLMALDVPDDADQGAVLSDETHFQKRERRREFLIRMLLSAAPDIRGLYIQLADRLCLSALLLKEPRGQSDIALFARLILDIYAPLAGRLGMWTVKSRLETQAFRLLDPNKYEKIARLITKSKSVSEKQLGDIIASLQDVLSGFGIYAAVTGREKHAYSIFRKMQAKGLKIEQINDMLGVRIVVPWSTERRANEERYRQLLTRRVQLMRDRQALVVQRVALLSERNTKQAEMIDQQLRDNQLAIAQNRSDIQDIQGRIAKDEERAKELCFDILGVLTDKWPPQTDLYGGQVARDWISKPKPNQYQSLHTTVMLEDRLVEVQIRTQAMHIIAEHGVAAAHWRYKDSKAYRRGKVAPEVSLKDAAWSEQVAEIRGAPIEERTPIAFDRPHHNEDRIFVITPMGDIVDLRAGASPIDFAYRIHTERGHTYAGAKVNGRIVRNDYELQNGDLVELLPGRGKGPSINWLAVSKDAAGKSRPIFARTVQARRKIRSWLRHNGMLGEDS